MNDPRAALLTAYAGEYRDHVAALRATLAERAAGRVPDLEEAYRHAHSLKGAARAVDLAATEVLAHGVESLLQAVWEDGAAFDDRIARTLGRCLDAIEDASAAMLGGEDEPDLSTPAAWLAEELDRLGLPRMSLPQPEPSSRPKAAPAVPSGLVRVEAGEMDRLLDTAGTLLIETDRHRAASAEARRLREEMAALRRLLRDPDAASLARARAAAETLAAGQARLAAALEDADWRIGRLAASLGDNIQGLRLVPAETAFAGLGRAAREAAAALGRGLDVEETGMETRADREVLQSLRDPVLHAVRNAVVHGIEAAPDREAAGKPSDGRLGIEVRATKGWLTVRVEDDGRGIDLAAVRRSAVARGLMSADEAELASPGALRALLFTPGFTTAGEVSSLAGRGMGMPIIRQAVTRLQGTVDLEESGGGGTAVVIRVPVALLAQRLVMVTAGSQVFGLPAAAVRRVAAVPRGAVTAVEGRTTAIVEGTEVRLVELARMIGLPAGPAEADPLPVVVLAATGAQVGLVVDALLDVRDLPVAALEPPLADHPLLAGSTILDEAVVLVLSPGELALRGEMPGAGPSVVSEEKPRRAVRVLVVDDSITTRTLEKSILEAHGYLVDIAVDGRQALDQLESQPADIVVSDIEMPRMDGFALLASIKRHPRLGATPVVLVTSRESEDDRRRGLDLGADAYIVKRRFDQQILLDTVAGLVPR